MTIQIELHQDWSELDYSLKRTVEKKKELQIEDFLSFLDFKNADTNSQIVLKSALTYYIKNHSNKEVQKLLL